MRGTSSHGDNWSAGCQLQRLAPLFERGRGEHSSRKKTRWVACLKRRGRDEGWGEAKQEGRGWSGGRNWGGKQLLQSNELMDSLSVFLKGDLYTFENINKHKRYCLGCVSKTTRLFLLSLHFEFNVLSSVAWMSSVYFRNIRKSFSDELSYHYGYHYFFWSI